MFEKEISFKCDLLLKFSMHDIKTNHPEDIIMSSECFIYVTSV